VTRSRRWPGSPAWPGNFGVLIFTLVLGKLVDQIGYGPFFVVLGLLDLVGAMLLWTLVRKRHVPAS
jgi:hypothetical protein